MNMLTLFTKGDLTFQIYGHWAKWAVYLRISFSWFLRILGLSAGVGILLHYDIFRKLAVGIGCFTIATVYWKHPYRAYLRHVQILGEQIEPVFQQAGVPYIPFGELAMPAMIFNCLVDVGFSLWLIHYFTRPQVVAQFRKIKT